jgi:hybrid cluster-associated redox disulfide protein
MHYCPVKMKMDTNMTINDLLTQHPQATNVFIRRMMLCVGCPAAGFHTLEDAAQLYGFALEDLAGEVESAIRNAGLAVDKTRSRRQPKGIVGQS